MELNVTLHMNIIICSKADIYLQISKIAIIRGKIFKHLLYNYSLRPFCDKFKVYIIQWNNEVTVSIIQICPILKLGNNT